MKSNFDRRCKSRTYRTVLDTCRFMVDVAIRPSCLYNSLEEKLNHDYCQTYSYKSRSAAAERTNVQDSGALSKDIQGSAKTYASSDVVSTTPLFIRSNQQPTSWSSSAGTLTHLRSFLSSNSVGALVNIPSGIAYTSTVTGAPATAVSRPTRRRTGPGPYGRFYN